MKNNILYLDDEKSNLETFYVSFEDDYNIFLANNKDQAIEILNNNEIKVLITDQYMPDITGVEFIKEIKYVNKDMVCIIITAYPDSNILMKVINELNIFRFIVKPWKENDLKKTLKMAIDIYDAEKEKRQLIRDLSVSIVKVKRIICLKSVSLRRVADEIISTLAGIMRYASINANEATNKELKKYERTLYRSSNELITVIEDLAVTSKLETKTEKF